jgi:putative membrane protein
LPVVAGLSLGGAGTSIKLFFLGCVLVAGVFGALTASRKIFWIQAMPAALAMVFIFIS